MGKKLQDQIIIVTGGNGLIGSVILQHIKKQGGFGINLEINTQTTENLSDIQCDITNQESIDIAISQIINKYKRIDGLVNNAYPRSNDWGNKFEDIEFQSWRQNIDWQLNSYFYMTQQVAIQMEKQNKGSIVNMASIYGVVAPDFNIYNNTKMTMPTGYAAIKGGVINLTKYVASYFGPKKVRANSVSPGGIFDNQNSIFVKNYEKKVPLRRMGTPNDIAPAVIFLLSDDSKYITGQNIIIDGGLTCI